MNKEQEPQQDPFTQFALHPFHALSCYGNEKQLVLVRLLSHSQMVFDNDCKYSLFKCHFVKEEDQKLEEDQKSEEVAESEEE